VQRNVINNNLRDRRRLSRGQLCSRSVPQFSHRNRKEFYENGCVFDGVQKRRYLPRSFAIMTNVQPRQRKKRRRVSLRFNGTTHVDLQSLILPRRNVRSIAKCTDDKGASHRGEIPRKIERFREKLCAASVIPSNDISNLSNRLITAVRHKIDVYSCNFLSVAGTC